jgi:hypothetical protein
MAPCPPLGGALPRMSRGCVTFDESLARGASSSGALPMGRYRANWELGFSQSRLDHGRQVLRSDDFCAFSSSSALPPGSCPRGLSALGKVADLWDSPPIPIPVLPGIRQELSWRTHPLHPCGVKPTYLNSSNVSRLFAPLQAVRTMNMIICEDLTHSHEIGTMRETRHRGHKCSGGATSSLML